MGGSFYSCDTRTLRAATNDYYSADVNTIFTQQKERRVHESMDSRKISFRECRDSENHPNTVPIILALDVTGSMGSVPRELIADGLPTLMSTLIQGGVPDASLLFLAIGDHEYDRHPLQIAQFESGDAELDMWLTRTYLEGGGGGNAGESYPLAWQFAATRTLTDAFEKRKEKGFLITIGDEPFLPSIPASALKEIYGETSAQQGSLKATDLHEAASEKYEVYHISLTHGSRNPANMWDALMGQHHIKTDCHTKIPALIAKIVIDNSVKRTESVNKVAQSVVTSFVKDEVVPSML